MRNPRRGWGRKLRKRPGRFCRKGFAREGFGSFVWIAEIGKAGAAGLCGGVGEDGKDHDGNGAAGGWALARALARHEQKSVAIALPALGEISAEESAAAIVEGILLAAFDYREYKGAASKSDDEEDEKREAPGGSNRFDEGFGAGGGWAR